MGKWVYMQDKNDTPAVELKKIANKLMTASMKSTIQLGIEFRIDHKELHSPSVDVTFFKDGTNFSVTMYGFYSLEKNQKIVDLVKTLIKDNSKFEQIKEQYKEIR